MGEQSSKSFYQKYWTFTAKKSIAKRVFVPKKASKNQNKGDNGQS